MTVDERFTDDYLAQAAGHCAARQRATRSSPARSPTGRPTSPTSSRSGPPTRTRSWTTCGERCPIAHTDRFGGGWLPTRYEDVAAIAYDTEHFTSRSIIMSNFRPPKEIAPVGTAPPISSDPPFHHDARKLLLPAFTKTAVAKLEPATREFCHSLIDAFEGKDVVDAAHDYAQHIPMRVIADMLGFPLEDGPQFREFVENALEGVNLPPEERIARMAKLVEYLLAQIQDHLANPRDDLTTYLAQRGDGRPEARPVPRRRHDGAAADRRHRHDVERDRRVAVAPGEDAGRPQAPRRRARAAADRDGGVPARVRAGHDGPPGQARHELAAAST